MSVIERFIFCTPFSFIANTFIYPINLKVIYKVTAGWESYIQLPEPVYIKISGIYTPEKQLFTFYFCCCRLQLWCWFYWRKVKFIRAFFLFPRACRFIKKESLSTGVFLWILPNFEEHLFYRTPPDDCLWSWWEKNLKWLFFSFLNLHTALANGKLFLEVEHKKVIQHLILI